MTIYINDFNVWQNLVPAINMAGDPEFDVWDLLVPLVDQDEGNPNTPDKRRRVSEF